MNLIRYRYGKTYTENIFYRATPDSQRSRARLSEVLAHKKAGRLLEIGCGGGAFLRAAQRHFDVEGIDVAPYVIRRLRKVLGERVKVKNIEQDDLTPNHYDVIVAFNVFEHLRNPEHVVAKSYHSLRKNGYLIGSVPNNCGVIGSIATRIANFMDRTHCSTYPPTKWYRVFKNAGFKHISFCGEIVWAATNAGSIAEDSGSKCLPISFSRVQSDLFPLRQSTSAVLQP